MKPFEQWDLAVDRPDWVYFIVAVRLGMVKIGHSLDPGGRLAEMQTGCPDQLVIAATTPGGRRLEDQLHMEFCDDNVRGEWFRLTDRIRDRIVQLGGRIPDGVADLTPREKWMQEVAARVDRTEGDTFRYSDLVEHVYRTARAIEQHDHRPHSSTRFVIAEVLDDLGVWVLAWANTLRSEEELVAVPAAS